MITFFKEYCKIKGIEHEYGFMRKDKNGKLYVETLKGDVITHVAYQHSPVHNPHWYYKYVDKLISISYATCGYNGDDAECKIGKPNQNCVDRKIYSPNKCAVVFAELQELEGFRYNLTIEQFRELAKQVKD